jgi:hypothetical protein
VGAIFIFLPNNQCTANSKVVDDIVYEVNCQMITIKPGADIDIGSQLQFQPPM